MRYLKEYKLFESRSSDIESILKRYNIKNRTINEDGTVDVDGSVDLYEKGLTKIPVKFRNVSGGFFCGFNQLTSLKGCPKEVGGNFLCAYNQLTIYQKT